MESNKITSPKTGQKDKIVIGNEDWIGGDDKLNFICSWCNCVLSRLIDSSGQNPSLYCSRCQMSFDPEFDNLRHESKITVPDRNVEPAITSIQYTADIEDDVRIRHTPEMGGGFAALSKKGTMKFTSYHTTEKE